MEWLPEWLLQSPLLMLIGFLAPVLINLIFQKFMKKTPTTFLDPNNFQSLKLIQKRQLTHNTVYLRFALPDPKLRLGLPIGQHITFTAADDDGRPFLRSYTPISDDDLLGNVDFVIKTYPTGKMSRVINDMKVGDAMMMKGPKGRFKYFPNAFKSIGMLAGGSGVTPMYQIAQAILKNPNDRTKVALVFGNVSEEDMLLKEELQKLADEHPNRFSVYHVLNNPPANWKGDSGFITKQMLEKYLPKPDSGMIIIRCGPPPMNDAMKKHLDAIGYTEEMQFQF